MTNIREPITAKLKTLCPRVYYERAPIDAQFPYIVYAFPNSFMLDEQEIWVLDVDIWDKPLSGDTTELDELSRGVADGLHRLTIYGPAWAQVYRESRFSLDDDEPLIRRRKITFQVRSFDLIKTVGV